MHVRVQLSLYAAHQINLQHRVSLPETTPTLRWTGKVVHASAFRVWGSRAFVRDTSADKLSSRAVPCVFLGFPPDAPGWQFYHPTSRGVMSSQDVTFDESVSYYHPAEPVEVAVESGAARGAEPARAGTGGAEPRGAEPDRVGSGSAEPAGAGTGGAEHGGAEPERVESGGAEPERVEPGGAEPGGTASWGAEPARAKYGGSSGVPLRREPLSSQRLREWYTRRCQRATGAAGAGAAGGAAGAGAAGGAAGAGAAGPGGARTRGTGAAGAGGAASVGAAGTGTGGAAGVVAGDPGAEGTGAVSAVSGGAARPRPYYVPLLQQVLGLPPSTGPTPPLLSPPPVQSQSQLQPASPLLGPPPHSGPTRGLTERREPESRLVSPESRPESPESRSGSPVRTICAGRRVSCPRPPPVPGTHSMTLRPSTAPQRIPLPSPPASSLPDGPDPESDSLRTASPTVTRFLATAVTDPLFESTTASALVAELVEFAAACRLDYATSLVAESASAFVCPLSVGGECAPSTDVLEDRQEEFECFAAAVPHLVSMLLAPEGDPDAPDIPTLRSYAEAIEGPYSSQWQAAMDAEMNSWKSTRTYDNKVPPPGANIVSGMWVFRVKRSPGSPPVFKARYVARGFSQRQGRDYELHSLDFSTTFLHGNLHEEIWLRRPPGFTGSFSAGTQWSLRRPVYGLRQAPRGWHDTLRTTLATLGFAPSTADPSLFLRTNTPLPPFYVLVYVDDLVFATADTEAHAHVKSELQKSHTCTDLGELTSYLDLRITRDRAHRTITLTLSHMVQQVLQHFGFTYSSPQSTPLPTGHSLSAPPSDESVEPSGPYPELVGCLMYLMTCTRPDLAYPLSLLARYVAPGRHRKVHWEAAKRVLRYLCSTSGMGLVLGGRARVVLTGHTDTSWVDDLATQRSSQGYTFILGSGSVSWRSTRFSSVLSSSCEAEIYAGAMAAQESRWLTYVLTELGEAPRSPPVLYVDNKAMLALCHEHRLEHRTKHIAVRYFLARELQQCGQLRLAYVASQANTADVFTKALQPCDHQPCFAFLDWSLRPAAQRAAAAAANRAPAATTTSDATTAAAARAATAGTTAVTALACALLPTHSTGLHIAATRGGQQQQQPLPDTQSPQQLREWAIQRARPGGGGFRFLRTAQRRHQSPKETFSAQLLSEFLPQRCVPGSVEAVALGASESATALGASESAAALGASESAAALGARASPATDSPLAPPPSHPSLPRLRSMHSRLLVSSLPRPLPSLPRSPAPPCLHCVEGRQCATSHSSEFPPTTAPLQTLHMDVGGTDQERYFRLVVDDYTRYTTIFPLRRKADVSGVLIHWIRATCRQLHERFRLDLPVLRLHSDRGGGDPAADNTAATRCSPCLETPPGFPPRPSLPPPQPAAVDSGAETTGAEPGGDETEGKGSRGVATGGAGSRGAATGGADSGGDASPGGGGPVDDPAGGPGAGKPPKPDLLETLSPQAIRAWIVRRGSLGSGGYSPAGAGGAGGTVGGAGGAASAGGTRGDAGPDRAGGAGGAGSGGAGVAGAGGAGSTTGAGGTRARGTGGAGAAGPGGACTGGPRGVGAGGATSARGAGAASAGGAKGATGTGGTGGATGAGGAGAGGPGGAGAVGLGGASTRGAGAAGEDGAGGAGGATGAAGTGGAGGTAGDGGTGAGGTGGTGAAGHGGACSRGAGAAGAVGAAGARGASAAGGGGAGAADGTAPAPHTEVTESLVERHEHEIHASTPVRARRVARPRPPAVPDTYVMARRPSTVPQPVPLPSPPASSLPDAPDLASDLARAASPTVTRLLATVVRDPDFESTAAFSLLTELVNFDARRRLDYVPSLVTESGFVCPPSLGGEPALSSDVLEDRQFELECLSTALPHFASMMLCPEGFPDAPDIPTPRSYSEVIVGEYSSNWQTAMDAEMASWKSTGTYADEVPSPGAKIVDGMWIFRVKRLPSSPPAFKVRYVARGFSQRQGVDFFQTFPPTPKMTTLRVLLYIATQRDYELHSLDFSAAFFAREWYDTLRTTLAALGFAPSSADLSLFLRTDTSRPPFYVLVYVDDLVFATADTEALALLKAELQERQTWVLRRFGFQYSSPQPTPLSTGHSLSAPPSDESVEPSGPYPELVGCLITSGMGLVLGGQGSVLLTGHYDASWDNDQATQRSSQGYTFSLGSGSFSWRTTRSSSVLGSSCEAEIYAGAMAAQELRWLTYLLTDLGERPHSPPILYVDNKAMLALCREQRLEHRTKHIALRFFLARELQ
ncbi:unnamed protein product [Closterium sp. NIES-53]